MPSLLITSSCSLDFLRSYILNKCPMGFCLGNRVSTMNAHQKLQSFELIVWFTLWKSQVSVHNYLLMSKNKIMEIKRLCKTLWKDIRFGNLFGNWIMQSSQLRSPKKREDLPLDHLLTPWHRCTVFIVQFWLLTSYILDIQDVQMLFLPSSHQGTPLLMCWLSSS